MKRRRSWLGGGLLAVALAVALIGSAAAEQFYLGLDTEDTEWVLGTEANLDVGVDAALVGGYGKLYRSIDDGTPVYVKTFELTSTAFSITGEIPSDPEYADTMCEFFYRAFTAGGAPVGVSEKVRRPVPPIEME